jgi:hypothetical protein
MLIDKDDYNIVVKGKTEDNQVAAQEILNAWSQISQLLKQSGWILLNEWIDKEFEIHNSVYNAKPEKLDHEQGYCTGLKFPAQTIRALKRKAVEAQKYLDSIAKQEKQND